MVRSVVSNSQASSARVARSGSAMRTEDDGAVRRALLGAVVECVSYLRPRKSIAVAWAIPCLDELEKVVVRPRAKLLDAQHLRNLDAPQSRPHFAPLAVARAADEFADLFVVSHVAERTEGRETTVKKSGARRHPRSSDTRVP